MIWRMPMNQWRARTLFLENKDKAERWKSKAKEAGDLIESECDKESFIFDLHS